MAQLMKLCSFGILLLSKLFLVWSLDIQAQVYKANNMQMNKASNMQMSSSLSMLSRPLDQCTWHRSLYTSLMSLSLVWFLDIQVLRSILIRSTHH